MEYSVRFFRIAARFLGVARIDLHEVAEVLRGLGYTITAPLPPKGFKVSIGGSGPIASKGNVVVDVNSDRMVIGVSSPEPEGCGLVIDRDEAAALNLRMRGARGSPERGGSTEMMPKGGVRL